MKNVTVKKTIALVVVLILIAAIAATAVIFLGKDKGDGVALTILQLTDVHIRNDESKDKMAFATIDELIRMSTPDLIIVTGDVTSEQKNEMAIKTFAVYMESKKIPWAFTFGNHDAEGDWKKPHINDYLSSLEYCIYERGDENVDGYGNYYYNVKNNKKDVVMSLLMMDSNMYYHDTEIGGYDNFHPNQIEWYEKTVKGIAKDVNGDETKVVPSLAFFHIPIFEAREAYDLAKKEKRVLIGTRGEAEASCKVDDMMFETMLRLKSTKGMYFGHDHMNDYSVEHKGIRMTYGNSDDHTIYFVPRKGGVVINVKNDGSYNQYNIFKGVADKEFTITEAF